LKILVIHASDVAIKGIKFGISQPKMLRVKKSNEEVVQGKENYGKEVNVDVKEEGSSGE